MSVQNKLNERESQIAEELSDPRSDSLVIETVPQIDEKNDFQSALIVKSNTDKFQQTVNKQQQSHIQTKQIISMRRRLNYFHNLYDLNQKPAHTSYFFRQA
jgi:hypothetical protein